MAAYATHKREPSARDHSSSPNRLELALSHAISGQTSSPTGGAASAAFAESSILDQLLDHIADRLAAVITDRLVVSDNRPDEWFDSRHAADYLGVHRDTLRKLAAERAIPSEQDGPGCKLYFRRSDLDAWRNGGGRPRHLASTLAAVV
ncbi:MAG TPA: helix-turn-helix domain-containing protein [Solirubrobacteraceae bacterium]|nr:helix-turn-helix domain-containing protein [Solirubrobacteraceae bacterium]